MVVAEGDIGPDGVLVVDLDGTLVETDMLYETFWAAFAARWTTPFGAAMALRHGRAALKRWLNAEAQVDVSVLPYNEAVLDYVKRWREAGGRTALVTASEEALADRIAAHLDLFDDVHGSDGTSNLKGANKARFLDAQYGDTGYAYMGDNTADFFVWETAAKAITVNATHAVRAGAEELGRDVEHIASRVPSSEPYLLALRPHQWLKNILIFLPMLASHQIHGVTILQTVFAFVAFSLVASSVYVLNDLLDLSADRAHPRKRLRPLASGSIPIADSTWLALLPLAAGFVLSVFLGWKFVVVLLGYYVVTTAYSLFLKRAPIIDICTLASLYTVRMVAGAAATGIHLSVWVLAFSVFFFFSLAAVKRQAELVDCEAHGRTEAAGRGYSVSDLPLVRQMAVSTGYVSVLVLALYLYSPAVDQLYSEPRILWGTCLVLLYWMSRIHLITHRGNMTDDPIVFAVKDRVSQICFLLIMAFAVSGAVM
ncbi:UbiA family prenyltransferase [Maritimibacter sp. 55A14]|uniref:UbiA family prenyltransferase n=1 Tax=Maritimibacter sp. 55A14 TaxID=2174844 RepID=UPI000D607AC5|nr:UbiA family prenyltransferase [Maritimibacter sp. 55A14]PWE32923.1 UbiA family prenyltransferase [Maritimibacter sp. 55A14]